MTRFLRLGISALAALSLAVGIAPGVSAQPKTIPLLLVGVGTTPLILDQGNMPGYVRPPVSKDAVAGALNSLCSESAGQEVRVESDGETLAVKSTKVLVFPSKNVSSEPAASDFNGSGAAAGYFAWEGTCITGVILKKVPVRKFYQVFIDGQKVSTYSFAALKQTKFRPLFAGDSQVCGINTILNDANGGAPICR